MHDHEPCDVDGCPALVVSATGLCAVHEGAKRVDYVLGGQRCTACQRLIERGEWVTRESTLDRMTHAHCPPKRVFAGRLKDRPKPLLAEDVCG
ncbi:MAG TPA: hypothetical protein VGY48_12550 [Vicinamibacterales bacterium]|jgi:hypothetical protein|nr:hypothetical protein [Vicinamibacterales bacterium]